MKTIVYYDSALVFLNYDSREKVAYTPIAPDLMSLKILSCSVRIIQ